MAKVLGLGGVFLKIADRDAWRDADFPYPDVGLTMLSMFAHDSDYFDPSMATFMINLIVDDLDGVLARAAAAGVEPLGRQDEDYGSFASLLDPAGIKIELWQPAPEAAA